MQKYLASTLVALVALSPIYASALTQEDLTNQVQQLLAQIAALSEQLQNLATATSTPQTAAEPAPSQSNPASAIACPSIDRTLSYGSSGDDVLSLQHFLNAVGTLDANSMTGFFGSKTEAAVKSWQMMQGIVSTGDAATTGFGVVGEKTRAAIAGACGGALSSPRTEGASLSVVGSNTSLQATATVVVNTANSCEAQSYTLDWGDGATVALPVGAGKCSAMQATFAHTYAKAGEYTVTISNGTSRATALASVSEAPICAPPDFALATSSGAVGKPYSLLVIAYPDASSSLTLVSTALPDGLALSDIQSTSTGALIDDWTITGTPSIATSTSVTISAHNDCGTSQATFVIPVQES